MDEMVCAQTEVLAFKPTLQISDQIESWDLINKIWYTIKWNIR